MRGSPKHPDPTTPRLDLADPEEAPTRALRGVWARVMSAAALLMAAFVLYTSGFGPWPNLMNRAIFLGLAFILTFGLYPFRKGGEAGVSILDVLATAAGLAGCSYVVVQFNWIMENPAESTRVSFWLDLLLVALVLEGMRRTIGLPFVIVALAALLYAWMGNHVPGHWGRVEHVILPLVAGPFGLRYGRGTEESLKHKRRAGARLAPFLPSSGRIW